MDVQVERHPKKRFFLKLLILALPFLFVIAIYFIKDPFMVLHTYKRFDKSPVMLNEAYIGWQNYMANRDSIGYTSFILGNSCTMAFKTYDWEKFLTPADHSTRFYDNGETLGGICQKLQALDNVEANIKNVLIVADVNTLRYVEPMTENNHLYSPEAAGLSHLQFHMKFLQEFLFPNFLIPYLSFLSSGKYEPSMRGIISPANTLREPYTNNFINPRQTELLYFGSKYWDIHKKDFKPRPDAGKVEPRIIYNEQIRLLKTINEVCKKHGANLKFILGPNYFQKKANPVDILLMKKILGSTSVWDFTGINKYTSDIHNYYESGHYRPEVGEELLQVVYNNQLPPPLIRRTN